VYFTSLDTALAALGRTGTPRSSDPAGALDIFATLNTLHQLGTWCSLMRRRGKHRSSAIPQATAAVRVTRGPFGPYTDRAVDRAMCKSTWLYLSSVGQTWACFAPMASLLSDGQCARAQAFTLVRALGPFRPGTLDAVNRTRLDQGELGLDQCGASGSSVCWILDDRAGLGLFPQATSRRFTRPRPRGPGTDLARNDALLHDTLALLFQRTAMVSTMLRVLNNGTSLLLLTLAAAFGTPSPL